MGRLTEKDDQGNWCIRGLPWKNLYPGIAITENTYERIYAVAKKLLDYEDTGLTPDQIRQMDALYTEKCREVAELRERDTAKEPEVHTNSDEIRVGSLVIGKGVKVYSCPKCGNMIRKSDNFCQECGQRLKLATAAQWPEWKDRMLHTFLGGHA